MKKWLLICPILFCLSCGNDTGSSRHNSEEPGPAAETPAPETSAPPVPPYEFAYRINEPDATFKLPGKLQEISGLSLSIDGESLLAVNDELGEIYYLDKNKGTVIKEVKFESNGDYEGIEAVNNAIYVVKSNGTIYEVKNIGEEKQETTDLKTDLGNAYNVEGLCFDPATGYLLLACKGKAGKGDEYDDKRAVYAYDLSSKKFLETPVLLIDRQEIEKLAEDGKAGATQKLAELFNPSLADDAFAPSGIAIHPLTREIYLVSSIGKILVIINSEGKILHLEPLDPHVHRQPEGITFDRDGTLYIGNEGRGGSGRLLKFSLH